MLRDVHRERPMPLLPKSKKARRRLMVVAVAAPILAAAVGLSLYAMGDAAVFFYSPSDAKTKGVQPGKVIRIGGLVQPGSLKKLPDGRVEFAVSDNRAVAPISFRGDLPDLFREGQGIVAQGAFDRSGVFEAREVLAKHDEKYMPKEVADALKKSGEWNRGGAPQ
jgi:cytochrome c-type biogenesis protein CcmE